MAERNSTVVLVLWHSSIAAQWDSGTVEQHSGTCALAQFYSSTVVLVLWHSSIAVQWNSGTAEQQSVTCILAQFYSSTVEQWHSGTVQWYLYSGTVL